MDLSFGLKSKRALEIHHYTSVQQGKIKTTCKRTWNGKELEARERKVLHRQGIIRQGSKLLSHISQYTSIFIQSSPFFYVITGSIQSLHTHTLPWKSYCKFQGERGLISNSFKGKYEVKSISIPTPSDRSLKTSLSTPLKISYPFWSGQGLGYEYFLKQHNW